MTSLFLNGVNVTQQKGIYLCEDGLINLMTPVPNKSYLTNKSANAHGTEILVDTNLPAYKDERNVTITVGIKQPSLAQMLVSFEYLTAILAAGKVELKTDFEQNTVYHLYYESCNQLQTYFRGIAKFTIKFIEPNPANRTATAN